MLYEFDQLPVGVEFYGLNLYVHNTMFYKVRYLRNCAPADQFCCFVCSAPFSRAVSFGIDLLQLGDAVVRIDLRRLQGRMSEQFLYRPHVGAVVEQFGGEGVPEYVRTLLP